MVRRGTTNITSRHSRAAHLACSAPVWARLRPRARDIGADTLASSERKRKDSVCATSAPRERCVSCMVSVQPHLAQRSRSVSRYRQVLWISIQVKDEEKQISHTHYSYIVTRIKGNKLFALKFRVAPCLCSSSFTPLFDESSAISR